MYLLDTNVVSELRRPRPPGAVLAWVAAADEADLHLSTVTIGEIQAGIELTRNQSPEKANELKAWLDRLSETYNVLSMDSACFRHWAKLMHKRSNTLVEDAMIAATAHVHGLTVVTRNLADFKALGSRIFNPFKA
jgi:toxin FitB